MTDPEPGGPVVMFQEWRHLLFLHWEVDPAGLRRLLPAGLDLDTFEGRAYVGLVPFTMRGVRPRFLPSSPWLSAFHETNVRTYVRCRGADPGVWFFSLDAANPVAVAIARATFGLPYFHARMTLKVDPAGPDAGVSYTSVRLGRAGAEARSSIRARPVGHPSEARPGTIEHFLAERYRLYSLRRGRLLRGLVRHTPYPLRPAEVDALDETLIRAAGIERPDSAPLAHYAEGVRVDVLGLTRA